MVLEYKPSGDIDINIHCSIDYFVFGNADSCPMDSTRRMVSSYKLPLIKEKFEDTKGIIKSRKSKKDGQCNGKTKKDIIINNDLEHTTQKTKD